MQCEFASMHEGVGALTANRRQIPRGCLSVRKAPGFDVREQLKHCSGCLEVTQSSKPSLHGWQWRPAPAQRFRSLVAPWKAPSDRQTGGSGGGQVVESRAKEAEADDGGAVWVSALTLVDLAGSERLGKTGAQPRETCVVQHSPPDCRGPCSNSHTCREQISLVCSARRRILSTMHTRGTKDPR